MRGKYLLPQLRNHLGGSGSQLGALPTDYYSLQISTKKKNHLGFFSCDKQRQKLRFGLSMILIFYVVTKVKHPVQTRHY